MLNNILGNFVLHSEMAVEKLGSRKSIYTENGSQFRCSVRHGQETKEEIAHWLPLLQSKAAQFLGLSVFFLRISLFSERDRSEKMFIFTERLMFSHYLGQIILLDKFFDGTFFTYGIEVMSFADRDQEDRIDPMIYVFPR